MKRKSGFKLLMISMLLLITFCMPASGASNTVKKAMKAYNKKLEKVTNTFPIVLDTFAVVYLNKDKIPEVIGYSKKNGGHPIIYTYKKNKVITLGSPNYTYYTHYYKKKNLVLEKGFNDSTSYQALIKVDFKKDNYSTLLTAYPKEGHYYEGYFDPNADILTKSQYDELMKKMTGNAKQIKIKYYKNTAKNRKKILK